VARRRRRQHQQHQPHQQEQQPRQEQPHPQRRSESQQQRRGSQLQSRIATPEPWLCVPDGSRAGVDELCGCLVEIVQAQRAEEGGRPGVGELAAPPLSAMLRVPRRQFLQFVKHGGWSL
jgi:hypothetical protein